MNYELIFRICSLAVVPGWILLLTAPKWKWTGRIAMFTIPLLLACAYIWVFIASFEGMHASYMSLAAVDYLLHTPGGELAAWIHLLAFDLFVAAWMVGDAKRLRILHLAVIPCLCVTFVFGPAGLLIYALLRAGLRRPASASQPKGT
jgi:hypothetical protein